MMNRNPFVYELLKSYSQSDLSTGGTRGYDETTYVETKLDSGLIPKVFNAATRLVVLTGNAGDGKTAFIQRCEKEARAKGAIFTLQTDNGCRFTLNEATYETLYDGSQDFEGTTNDALLTEFFVDFQGDKAPNASVTKIIAINEGKLRDFVLPSAQFKWLAKQLKAHLQGAADAHVEGVLFVNLNLRSVVDSSEKPSSIFDLLLDHILDPQNERNFWTACTEANCAYSPRCYIRYNIETLRDPIKGSEVRARLKQLFLAIHLRKTRHITMRDLRSIMSFVLLNKRTCEQLQADLDQGLNPIDRFYYNAAFGHGEHDRIAQLLSEVDVAAVSNPKLDNSIHFLSPDRPEMATLFLRGGNEPNTDVEQLKRLFDSRPEGTQDTDPSRLANAKAFHASIRRKLYFEGDAAKLKTLGVAEPADLLPYRQLARYVTVLKTGFDPNGEVRDEITLAISKSERIYNETVGTENLCLRSTGARRTQTKAFYAFPASDFEVSVRNLAAQSEFVEHFPNSIWYRHIKSGAELEIPLDLFEILVRIRYGFLPTAHEVRTFFLNLEMFKRRITSRPSDQIILTEDDTNLFEIRRDPLNRLVMAKLGG